MSRKHTSFLTFSSKIPQHVLHESNILAKAHIYYLLGLFLSLGLLFAQATFLFIIFLMFNIQII